MGRRKWKKKVQSKALGAPSYRKKFKWPRNLQDPKPVIKDKQVKTETTFLTYQMGKNVTAW